MEELFIFKSRPISIVLLLLILLLSIPYFSTGNFYTTFSLVLLFIYFNFSVNLMFLFGVKGSLDVSDKEVYEIDYRGPETHSSIPPPDHSHGHRHWVHRETDILSHHKSSKGLRGGGHANRGRNVSNFH